MIPKVVFVTAGVVAWLFLGLGLFAWRRWIEFNDRQQLLLKANSPDHPLIIKAAERILMHFAVWIVSLVGWFGGGILGLIVAL